MDLGSVLGGVATGGIGSILGIAGSLAGSWLKGKQAKTDHLNKMEFLKFELDSRIAGHGQAMDELRQTTSSTGLLASIEADSAIPATGWAANLKAVYRPFLTTALLGISTFIFYFLLNALSGDNNVLFESFDKSELTAMLRYSVYTLIFSTATAITWWFGDRAFSPPNLK
jgi:hypothetical protein